MDVELPGLGPRLLGIGVAVVLVSALVLFGAGHSPQHEGPVQAEGAQRGEAERRPASPKDL